MNKKNPAAGLEKSGRSPRSQQNQWFSQQGPPENEKNWTSAGDRAFSRGSSGAPVIAVAASKSWKYNGFRPSHAFVAFLGSMLEIGTRSGI
jgi:hypothetical protein